MKTIRQEYISPEYVDEFIPPKGEMRPGIIYISLRYRASSHLCLCGCGHECYLQFKDGEWNLVDNGSKITITPSIQQRFECKSHYIITNGKANFV